MHASKLKRVQLSKSVLVAFVTNFTSPAWWILSHIHLEDCTPASMGLIILEHVVIQNRLCTVLSKNAATSGCKILGEKAAGYPQS